jgi:hypothetical protein
MMGREFLARARQIRISSFIMATARVVAATIVVLLFLLSTSTRRYHRTTTKNSNTPSSSSSSYYPSSRERLARRALPSKVLIGYTAGRDYATVRNAIIRDKVNVVIWSFIEIIVPASEGRGGDEEVLKTNLDIHQIQQLIIELDMSGYSHVVHLASLGGWNGPHLQVSSTTMNAREYSNNWMSAWRSSIVSTIFHGIDWDFEGNDNVMSPLNYFDQTLLDSMGHISQQMKDEGYIVTIAPPQSYLNFDNSNFEHM